MPSSLLYGHPIPYIICLNNWLWPTFSILLINFYYKEMLDHGVCSIHQCIPHWHVQTLGLGDHLPLRTPTYVCTRLFLFPCTARGLATGSYQIFKMGSQFHSELEWAVDLLVLIKSNSTSFSNFNPTIHHFIYNLASSNCLTYQCNYTACSTCSFYEHLHFKLKGDNKESIQLFDLVSLPFKFKMCNYLSHHPIPLLALPPLPLDRSE